MDQPGEGVRFRPGGNAVSGLGSELVGDDRRELRVSRRVAAELLAQLLAHEAGDDLERHLDRQLIGIIVVGVGTGSTGIRGPAREEGLVELVQDPLQLFLDFVGDNVFAYLRGQRRQ